MNKNALIAITIIIVLSVALVGAGAYIGRRGQKIAFNNENGSIGAVAEPFVSGGESSENVFNKSGDTPVTDPVIRQVDPAVKAALREIFGGAKVTGYIAGFIDASPGDGATVEYTVKRLSTTADLSLLIAAFARVGYAAQFSGQQENAALFMVRNGSYIVTGSYEIGSQKITVSAAQAQATE